MARDATERDRISSAHDVYLGFDVGKSFHWACALKGDEKRVDRAVMNRRDDARDAIAEARALAGDLGVLVTVDQRNNIGSLVVREARSMGCDVAYLPGIAEKRARDMYPKLAKNDRFDAWVIAHTSEASPQTLLPIPDSRETRLLGSQRRHCVKLATQARNRLHALLLEGDPELEAACDLSLPWLVGLLGELGGANGIARCSRRRYNSLCKRLGAPQSEADDLRGLAERSVERGFHPQGEDACVRWLAADILRADAEAERLKAESHRALADDECYRCLLTVPGIGPACAEALVSLVDISLFEGHGQLASLCGLAPANSSSSTSIDHATAPKSGNKELKNLLIFTVNSLIGTKGYFGRYYDTVLERSSGSAKLRRKKAMKAVGAQEAQGHIRRDARPRALRRVEVGGRRLTRAGNPVCVGSPWADATGAASSCPSKPVNVQRPIVENSQRKTNFNSNSLDKTIGTPPVPVHIKRSLSSSFKSRRSFSIKKGAKG